MTAKGESNTLRNAIVEAKANLAPAGTRDKFLQAVQRAVTFELTTKNMAEALLEYRGRTPPEKGAVRIGPGPAIPTE